MSEIAENPNIELPCSCACHRDKEVMHMEDCCAAPSLSFYKPDGTLHQINVDRAARKKFHRLLGLR